MDLKTVLAGASRLSYGDALRIARQFNPQAWDRAHLQLIAIAGNRGQIDSIQIGHLRRIPIDALARFVRDRRDAAS